MSLVFQRGERLTAAKLNQLVGMIEGGTRSEAALGTQIPQEGAGPFPQRVFTSYVPALSPVYVDKAASLIGAPNSGSSGWVYRGGTAGESLSVLPGAGLGEAEVWEKVSTDSSGTITAVEMGVGDVPAEQARVPGQRGGTYVRQVGKLKKDGGKAGVASATMRFFDYRRPPVPATLVSTLPPASNIISLEPSNGNVGPSENSNVTIMAMETDGGLLHDRQENTVLVQPRFELVAAPNTAVAAPETGFSPYAPETGWQELGSVEIAGGTLSLSALWLRPWKAQISLRYAPGTGGEASFPPGLYSAATNTVIPWSEMVPGSLVRLSYSSDTTLGVSAFTFAGGYLSFIVDRA